MLWLKKSVGLVFKEYMMDMKIYIHVYSSLAHFGNEHNMFQDKRASIVQSGLVPWFEIQRHGSRFRDFICKELAFRDILS